MSAVAVVTANEGVRAGKKIPLRKTVAHALADNACPSIKNVFVKERTPNSDDIEENDVILNEAMKTMSTGSDMIVVVVAVA